ncbi:MAG: DUF11 domain-containing protein, partial [Saprospiraceae bacterium]|nr:DUF11 domain-containing protein [Saprospiraceae bacterium]
MKLSYLNASLRSVSFRSIGITALLFSSFLYFLSIGNQYIMNDDVFNASISLSNNSPSTVNAGSPVTYIIKYSTQSNTNNFNNAQILVTIPAPEVVFLGFTGTADVFNTNFQQVGNEYQLAIDMIDPLPAGSTGQMEFEVSYAAGSLCDGEIITVGISRTADNALGPNEGPSSVDVTVNDDTEPFSIQIDQSGIIITDREIDFTLDVLDNSTVVDELSNRMLIVSVPMDVRIESCSGCDQQGSLPTDGLTQLTWNLGTVSSSNLPNNTFSVTLPSDDYGEGDSEVFVATLSGDDNICSMAGISIMDQTEITVQPPPAPTPMVQCIQPAISETIIGESGILTFSFKNSSTLASLDDFTYSLSIPPAMAITSLPNVTFTDGVSTSDFETGLSAQLSYTTNVAGPTVVNFTTNTTSSAVSIMGVGEYITSLTYTFNDPVPENFMPIGNLIVVGYTVLETLTDGILVNGANPRIADNLSCVDCDNNPDYDCLDVEGSLSATFMATPVSATGNCSVTEVIRDPEVGIQGVGKSLDKTSGYYPREEVTFTLAFENCGTDPLTSTVITDELESGLTIDPTSFSYSGFSALPSPPTIINNSDGSTLLTWNIGVLPAADPCQAYE